MATRTPKPISQQLHAAIERRVKLELRWAEAQAGSQLPEHRKLLEQLRRARGKVSRLLEQLWYAETHGAGGAQ